MMSICCICVLKINRNFWGVLGHDRLQYLVLSWRKPEDVYVKCSSYHTIDHWQHYVRVSLSLSLFLSLSLSLSFNAFLTTCMLPLVYVFFFFPKPAWKELCHQKVRTLRRGRGCLQR